MQVCTEEQDINVQFTRLLCLTTVYSTPPATKIINLWNIAKDCICGWRAEGDCCGVMRRPTLCSDVHTVDDTYLNAAQGATPVDKEGRLSKVKRMLADSLLLGRRATSSPCSRHFGVPLDEVVLTKEGVPVVISKICSFLENNGK